LNRTERGEWLNQQVETAIGELEEQLAQGYTEGYLEVLDFYDRFHKYSLANIVLILMQNADATLCAGFKAWEKMGYHVRGGESAIWVRAPMTYKEVDQENGQTIERVKGYTGVAIFDRSQLVEDVELPDLKRHLEGDFEFHYFNAKLAIGRQGILVDEEPLPNGVHGLSMGGRIVINQALTSGEKFLTCLHELIHELLHKGQERAGTTREQRELEAESGSYLLSRLYGLTNTYSRDYILSWKGTVEGLHDSLTRINLAAKKAADLLPVESPKPQEVQVAA
jgi:hypothetical protein